MMLMVGLEVWFVLLYIHGLGDLYLFYAFGYTLRDSLLKSLEKGACTALSGRLGVVSLSENYGLKWKITARVSFH